MSKILVTGGAGFIGSHTCLALLQKKYKIVVLDSFRNSSPISLEMVKKISKINSSNNNEIEIIKGDLRNFDFIDNIFIKSILENSPIDVVIHFAGLKSVDDSIINPLDYWDNNVVSTINLLKAMKKNNCRNIVFSSSATIYGYTNDKNLLSENSLIRPVNPYGYTKSVIEKILENLSESEDRKWRIANLRYFNPIGAHSSGLLGEDPLGVPDNIFPLILQVAAGKLKELTIFGNDWPTVDGTGVRDYLHVLDLAEGHILALKYILENKPTIINLNLGTGKGSSVLELIKCFEEVNNVKVPYVFSKRRYGDLPYLVANNSKALKILNWEPKRSLKEMCIDGWKWQKNNPNGYLG